MKNINRRNFLRKTSLASAAVTMAPALVHSAEKETTRPSMHTYMGGFAAPKLETVRAAFIGVGNRGPGHLKFFADLPGTEWLLFAICMKTTPKNGEKKRKKLVVESDIKMWHSIMVMKTNGEPCLTRSACFCEVPIALSLEEMWNIVDTSEATGKHCMMMENVNYAREELMYLNMCRLGVIGEPLHAEAAYIHELRFQMEEQERGTGSWRTGHYARRNGNLYPTHGLGPVAQYMNLARTEDNFGTIVSYSTPARGRKLYAEKNYPADHKWNQLDFKGGDMNTSIVKTHLGRTIMLQWDETSPRPYTRHNLIQGTKGILAGFPTRVALEGGIEGVTENHHEWAEGEKLAAIYEKYDHPLYKRLNEAAKGSGHGGMDGLMMYRIVECLQKGLPLDQNVYEGCYWSAVETASDTTTSKEINIVYGANLTKDEILYPGAFIFSEDGRQVQFEHQGADLWCDVAVFYKKENRLKAIGNIRLQQGDSVKMTSGKMDYDGELKLAKAYENVVLESQTSESGNMTLTTDTLRFDRENQQAYYQDFGTVIDSANTLTSEIGRYFMETKKYQFLDSVHIKNPQYILDSEQLDYYTSSKNAYMYGPSTITGETYKIYCERGYYDTKIESGYGIKNTRIDYNDRIIVGDSVYFDKAREFASATNNITVTDTINNGIIRAHYAEVYKANDSVFATKRAVAISLVEQDSLYTHGDTLMITGVPEARIMRAYNNAKFFKTNMSGKADSIHSEQKTGIVQLITNPVIWNGVNQMTGDSIRILSNVKTEKLDSLKVLNNAFIISLDSISKTGYNQAKGVNLYGKFKENELRIVDLDKNTEVIYYMYNSDDELIGINKTIASAIRITMANNDVEELTFKTQPEGDIFPEKELPLEERKLKGFIWRGDEQILTKDDIFDEDDNNIELVVIKGIDNPIDIDAEEEARSLNAGDPVNKIPLPENDTSKEPKKRPKVQKVKAN
ncbi:Glycosyl hydrolase family 109 protein 1 [Nymphon striatum]|nr:Glycosyl hydrolase family 109 protein 1 [Nymphon striatum]